MGTEPEDCHDRAPTSAEYAAAHAFIDGLPGLRDSLCAVVAVYARKHNAYIGMDDSARFTESQDEALGDLFHDHKRAMQQIIDAYEADDNREHRLTTSQLINGGRYGRV